MHRTAHPAGAAKYPQIALDFGCAAGGFVRSVREFYGGSAIGRRHLAHDRDRIEIGGTIRRAAHEIIGEVGAPAKTDPDPAGEMAVGLFDRSDVHGVRENPQLFPGIPALLLTPLADFLALRDRRRAVGAKAGPVRYPFGGISEE